MLTASINSRHLNNSSAGKRDAHLNGMWASPSPALRAQVSWMHLLVGINQLQHKRATQEHRIKGSSFVWGFTQGTKTFLILKAECGNHSASCLYSANNYDSHLKSSPAYWKNKWKVFRSRKTGFPRGFGCLDTQLRCHWHSQSKPSSDN